MRIRGSACCCESQREDCHTWPLVARTGKAWQFGTSQKTCCNGGEDGWIATGPWRLFSCGAAGVLPECRCEVDRPGYSVRLPILRGRKGKVGVSDGGAATPKAGGATPSERWGKSWFWIVLFHF